MNVAQLIDALSKLPDQECEVLLWDGGPTTHEPQIFSRPGFDGGWGYTLPTGRFDARGRPVRLVIFLTDRHGLHSADYNDRVDRMRGEKA